ncbi:MAG: hypothetical protein EOO00_10430 [Chitinophagaceae bacterium]|nr:MAG: hypothetical protein EOO00_10430 [Chitinophagaceae bacterium]
MHEFTPQEKEDSLELADMVNSIVTVANEIIKCHGIPYEASDINGTIANWIDTVSGNYVELIKTNEIDGYIYTVTAYADQSYDAYLIGFQFSDDTDKPIQIDEDWVEIEDPFDAQWFNSTIEMYTLLANSGIGALAVIDRADYNKKFWQAITSLALSDKKIEQQVHEAAVASDQGNDEALLTVMAKLLSEDTSRESAFTTYEWVKTAREAPDFERDIAIEAIHDHILQRGYGIVDMDALEEQLIQFTKSDHYKNKYPGNE